MYCRMHIKLSLECAISTIWEVSDSLLFLEEHAPYLLVASVGIYKEPSFGAL